MTVLGLLRLHAPHEIRWIAVTTESGRQFELRDPVVTNDSLIGYQILENEEQERLAIPVRDLSARVLLLE